MRLDNIDKAKVLKKADEILPLLIGMDAFEILALCNSFMVTAICFPIKKSNGNPEVIKQGRWLMEASFDRTRGCFERYLKEEVKGNGGS